VQQLTVATSSDGPAQGGFALEQGYRLEGVVTGPGPTGYEPVAGAIVQACTKASCVAAQTQTDVDGNYEIELPGEGEYEVTAFPPTSNAYGASEGVTGPIQVKALTSTANVELPTLNALPPGVEFNRQTETEASVYWANAAELSIQGCHGGVGAALLSAIDSETDEAEVTFGGLEESPSGSGKYSALVPPLYPAHGTALLRTTTECPPETALLPADGPAEGGNAIDIAGQDLAGTTAVLFAGKPAESFRVISASEIEAVPPAGTGTVEVEVVTGEGDATAGGLAQYTYLAVEQVTPSAGPVAGGTPVTIAGRDLAAVQAVYFGDAAARNVAVLSSTELTATAPSGSGSVPVTIVLDDGATSNETAVAFQYEPSGAAAAGSKRAGSDRTAPGAPVRPARLDWRSLAPASGTNGSQHTLSLTPALELINKSSEAVNAALPDLTHFARICLDPNLSLTTKLEHALQAGLQTAADLYLGKALGSVITLPLHAYTSLSLNILGLGARTAAFASAQFMAAYVTMLAVYNLVKDVASLTPQQIHDLAECASRALPSAVKCDAAKRLRRVARQRIPVQDRPVRHRRGRERGTDRERYRDPAALGKSGRPVRGAPAGKPGDGAICQPGDNRRRRGLPLERARGLV
jgi:hypothetical protein